MTLAIWEESEEKTGFQKPIDYLVKYVSTSTMNYPEIIIHEDHEDTLWLTFQVLKQGVSRYLCRSDDVMPV